MTVPWDARGGPPARDYETIGVFTPHSANEGDHGAEEWLAEVLPADEFAPASAVHREDHLPHGWHDFGALGWTGSALMLLVLGLIVWGYVLPWLGLTRMWAVDPLR